MNNVTDDENRDAVRDKTIIILAPTRNDAAIACATLAEAGLHAEPCQSIDALRSAIAAGAGAAIIAQEALTPPFLDMVAGTLSQQPPWSDLPIIILTQRDQRQTGAPFGSRDLDKLNGATFLERPFRMATLVRAVQAALEWRQRQYDIRDYLYERQRVTEERMTELRVQRDFVRGVLASVSGGKLIFCSEPDELPIKAPHVSRPLELNRYALSDFRCDVLETADTLGFPDERKRDLVTAASEVAMNAVVHAGGGVGYVADDRDGLIQVWVADSGAGISMDRLPQATLERGFSSAGTLGHGFWLALNSCDRLYLQTGPAGTTVVLEQQREQPAPSDGEWWKAPREALNP